MKRSAKMRSSKSDDDRIKDDYIFIVMQGASFAPQAQMQEG